MSSHRAFFIASIAAFAAVSACKPAPSSSAAAAPAVSASASVTASGPHATLERMDTRAPVPLLPMMANHQKQNMREHLEAVQDVVLGATSGDFAAVEKAAGRMGYSEQMGRMCTHMGAGAPGFTEQALNFHRTADKIGDAAKKKDREGVLAALGETLKTCTGCHAVWKQRVVDEADWGAATASASGAASVAPMMHHGP
jgi:hypothetical protein